jgi:hypothetical protein
LATIVPVLKPYPVTVRFMPPVWYPVLELVSKMTGTVRAW